MPGVRVRASSGAGKASGVFGFGRGFQKTAGGRDRASGEKEYGKYGSGKGQDIAGGMRGTAQNSDAGLRGKPASGHGDGGSVTRGTDQGSRGGKNAGRNHVRRKS